MRPKRTILRKRTVTIEIVPPSIEEMERQMEQVSKESLIHLQDHFRTLRNRTANRK